VKFKIKPVQSSEVCHPAFLRPRQGYGAKQSTHMVTSQIHSREKLINREQPPSRTTSAKWRMLQ